jgi:hypothetical protein
MIDIVDEKDLKSRIITDGKGKRHRTYSERKCCYPKCSHPNETYIDPVTGVAAWYKVKTIAKGEKVWDGKSYYCNEHEHKMRKQIRKGTLKSDSNVAKGDRVERAFEKIGYRNCNKEKDDYNFPYDLYDPIKRLRIQARSIKTTIHIKKWIKVDGTEGIKKYTGWDIGTGMERNYDCLFAICMAEDRDDIDRIYNIPEERLPISEGISIYKENVESHIPINSQYEDCKDEELLQKVRKAYREILIEDGIIPQ